MMIKNYRAVLLLTLLLSVGCGLTQSKESPEHTLSGGVISESLKHDGVQRRYSIQMPQITNQERLLPLVVVLHGGGGRGDQFDRLMADGTLSTAANKRSVILAFPEGIRKQWHDGRAEIVKGKKQRDDVGFISSLIDKLVDERRVDPKRVFVTGISNGGHMSFRLAMDLSEKIAAVAPVAAQVSKAIANKRPQKPISVLIMNGTEDPLVPYEGGDIKLFKLGRSRGEVLSAEQSARLFQQYNACEVNPVVKQSPDRDPSDKTRIVITTYKNCRDKAKVMLVSVEGGGHTWPGGYQYLKPRRVGYVSREINASDFILDFFLMH